MVEGPSLWSSTNRRRITTHSRPLPSPTSYRMWQCDQRRHNRFTLCRNGTHNGQRLRILQTQHRRRLRPRTRHSHPAPWQRLHGHSSQTLMPFQKPCLNCGALIRGASYCPPCQPRRERNPQREQKKRHLYGGTYKTRARHVRQTASVCHLCGQPFHDNDTIEADHLFPELGHESPLAPAHRHCNQNRGNRPLN